ncbi:glycosyl transferase [Mycobacterium sp. 852002-51613_SCH5001154]|uniref:glycosyltransferase n=1 Tax=Mycobacterium sp. 852002-51613_SCH5001154 TaxID=1834104 RepID=UPI0008014D3C|nr:nucleotide disphospho-sugar-binding domain-containing protein [Mycobacterium sp. 852002-51613_SCH5001154]OBF72113.1 glycosyl transferase [Mycobacterium sp. 852002-51613_SCH5001154]
MATILAYTSPALGHLLPMSALLSELSSRGHGIYVRTLSSGVDIGRKLGFTADAIDPRIEAIELGDSEVTANPLVALKRGVASFGRRAVHEVADLGDAIARVGPDALLVDVNCWGALSAAETGEIPWACFVPYTPPLRSPGVPPFGPGLRPMSGALGRLRDAAVRIAVEGPLQRVMLPPINGIRADLELRSVASMDEFLRRAPLLLVASGKPFQYPQTDWGDGVQLIGPCVVDPGPHTVPDWLASIDQPIVLVTTSSEKQADTNLIRTALAALKDEPVHVVATLPAGRPDEVASTRNATVLQFIPHGLVLDRAVCAVTHGGMGATQKALARGIPVCVVPYGRDQLEVARRVEVAQCGTRLPAKKLTPSRLRTKVREAMTMTHGAKRVAAGFKATGGTARGADLFEQRLLGTNVS